ncbi:MAG TPA: hypothetical protein VNZ53_36185 [Steroidobacteraceae bacterium]|nr:hypothetical protein [Steroidobacteraceae bacterium]
MHRNAISHLRLMRESTDRIGTALRSEDDRERRIALRLAESAKSWQLWEDEHSGLMRQIADYGVLRTQAAALRQTAIRLIHGKSLFEYLRRNELRGERRSLVLNHFHPTREYQQAVIAEHGGFVRKACSYLCTSHVGTGLVHDPAFLDPMQHYESLYAEYFDLYCAALFPDSAGSAGDGSLLPLLKHQLNEWRWIILNPRQSQPRVKREREMRRPTGDTQRLRRFRGRPENGG